MSFSNLGTNIPIGPRAGASVLRGSSLGMMSQYLLTILAAAILAAVYQLTQEETKRIIEAIKSRSRYRSERNDTLLLEVLGSEILPDIQDRMLQAHDTFRAAMKILADPTVDYEDKKILKEILHRIHGSRRPDDVT